MEPYLLSQISICCQRNRIILRCKCYSNTGTVEMLGLIQINHLLGYDVEREAEVSELMAIRLHASTVCGKIRLLHSFQHSNLPAPERENDALSMLIDL